MAYALEPGLIPDAQNPNAQRYALYRLNQQAQLGQLTPEEIAAARVDPAGWWRAYSAAVGGVIPQQQAGSVGIPTAPTALAAAAAHGRALLAHAPHVTARHAVMQRLTHGFQQGQPPYGPGGPVVG